MNRLSIVGLTLNFRDAVRTQRCVDSLLGDGAQHVLIWDNSDDGGVSAQELTAKFSGREHVTLLMSPANLGFSAAVNRGIEWISERFGSVLVALVNNDAVFLPGALSALSHALVERSEGLLAYPIIRHGDEIVGSVYYQRWLGLLSRSSIPGSAPYVSGCALLIAPNRLTGALFDEDFFMYGEDMELGWRLVQHIGWAVHVPEVWVWHEGSASSGMGSEFYESRMVAAHLLLARKLSGGMLEYAVMIFGRFFALTARAILRAWRYRSFLPVRALWLGWGLFRGNDELRARALRAVKANQWCVISCGDSSSSSATSWAASIDMPAIQGTGSPGVTR